jgi:Acetyltransferase (GNAT) domain
MTDYCGPLIREVPSLKASRKIDETQKNLNALREFLCTLGLDSIHLKFSPGLENIRPFTFNGWDSKVHYTYYLDLKENIENNISRTIRKDLKYANEAGLRTRVWNDLETYYGLLLKVYEKQNLKPPVAKLFFEKVFNLIREKDIGYMLVCETPDGEVVASHLTLYGKKSTVNWSTSRNPSTRLRGSNALLYYDEFLDLKSRDFEYMNVMSANTPRFADFIGGFSPKLIPYYSVTLNSKRYSILKNLIKSRLKP